jgi:cation:H+ antiporter
MVPVLLIVVGLGVAIWSSRVVVDRASALVAGTSVSPFLIGLVLLALGTDLPEIANSIASSLSGHGDINVGDSIGSAVTQSTLVLAILPLVGGAIALERRDVYGVGFATAGLLLVGAFLLGDGRLDRVDGWILVGLWGVASFVVWRIAPPLQLPLPIDTTQRPRRTLTLLEAIGGLAVVGGGAYVAVRGFIQLSEAIGLSEYVVSFFLASIGTSLPELVVDATALRRGEREMAVGGLLGASMLDASVSIGSGPIVAPTDVTAELAVRGSLLAALAILAVTLLLGRRERHDWRTALALLAVYAIFFPVLLGG